MNLQVIYLTEIDIVQKKMANLAPVAAYSTISENGVNDTFGDCHT